jgi:hypothetical protein
MYWLDLDLARREFVSMASLMPAAPLRTARATVLLVGLAAAAAKVAIAATTQGTNDVRLFTQFARTIAAAGPVGVYGVRHAGGAVYNHGPLTGLLLDAMGRTASLGAPLPLLIRLPACCADLLTCLLVFELARTRMGIERARWCGTAVALSPVLVAVSGFHGNTDPVFVALVLLSAWLLTARQVAVPAGIALGLALSVKLVPAVAVPVLLIAAFRADRCQGYRFSAGLAATLAALWAGPALRYPMQVRANVLDYAGVLYWPWGLPHFAALLGVPQHWLALWEGPGRFSVVLLAAGTGSWIAWHKPCEVGSAVGLSLAAMLLLSTASAAQYLSWAAAGVVIADFWSGLAYNLIAGAFLTEVYSRWSGGGFWGLARAARWTPLESQAAAGVWATLAIAVVTGFRAVLRQTEVSPDLMVRSLGTLPDRSQDRWSWT